MNNFTKMILLTSCVLMSLVSCAFVATVSSIAKRNTDYMGVEIPGLTQFVCDYKFYAFILPALIAITSYLWIIKKANDNIIVSVCCFSALASFTWPLVCIVSWLLPWIYVGGSMG